MNLNRSDKVSQSIVIDGVRHVLQLDKETGATVLVPVAK